MARKVFVFVFALAAAAGGSYFLSKWIFKKEPAPTKPQLNVANPLESVPIPSVRFTDVTRSAGIDFVHVTGATGAKLLPETMGGGVAIFDYDGDGWQDILFVQSGELPGHSAQSNPTMKLYRNRGGWKFEDVTVSAGLNVPCYGMGVCIGDINNDGRPDIYISAIGKGKLFQNVDGKRFADISAVSGTAGEVDLPSVTREKFVEWVEPIPFSASCTFVDYDQDGRLDLFVCRYITWSPKIDRNVSATLDGSTRAYVPPKDFNGALCKLYRNVDGTRFVDVSKEAGIEVFTAEGTSAKDRKRPAAKALGVVSCDPDEDGYPDLMIANDGVPNFFFHNVPSKTDGKRIFEEIGYTCGVALPEGGRARGGMGIDFAEYKPGRCAAVIANFANEPTTFLKLIEFKAGEPKDPFFTDVAVSNGIAGPSRNPLKFGAFFFDYDLDGRQDLLTCNGHIEPDIAKTSASQSFPQPAQLFWNTGLDRPAFQLAVEGDCGADILKPIVGRGSAFGDLDGDGDLDVVLIGIGGPPSVLRNDSTLKHHWIRLRLEADGKSTNRDAYGAVVTVESSGRKLTRFASGARGYLSQSESSITIGLGTADKVDRITVTWPGKNPVIEVFETAPADQRYVLKQGAGKPVKE